MKLKQFICFLIAFLYACSAPQRVLPPGPNVLNETTDAGTLFVVDRDAYNTTLPPVEDVAINLSISDSSGPNGERIAPLRVAQPAPFNGVLFNGPSVARLQVEFRGQAAQCQINRQADLDRLAAQALRDIEQLNSSILAQRQSSDLMIRSRDNELERLYSYIRRNNEPVRINPWPYIGIGLGGIVLGAAAVTTIYFLTR